MFNLGKVYLVIEKSTALVGIGLVATACGFFMLKNGLEKLIYGAEQDRFTRYKAILVIVIAILLMAVGLFTILEADFVLRLLSKNVRDLLEVPLGVATL